MPSAKKRSSAICRGAAYLGREAKSASRAQAAACGFAEAPPALVIGCKNVPEADALLIGSKRGAADRSEDGLCPVRIVPVAEDRRADFVPRWEDAFDLASHFAVAVCRFHLFVCFVGRSFVCAKTPDCSVLRFFAVQGDKDSASRAQKQAKIADLPRCRLSWAEASAPSAKASEACGLPSALAFLLSVARMFREADALLIGSKVRPIVQDDCPAASIDGFME